MTLQTRRAAAFVTAALAVSLVVLAQSDSSDIVGDYWLWREQAKPLPAGADPIALFQAKLRADGLSEAAAAEKVESLRKGLIAEEGEFYDGIYERGPKFNPKPSALLIEAVEGRGPGDARAGAWESSPCEAGRCSTAPARPRARCPSCRPGAGSGGRSAGS